MSVQIAYAWHFDNDSWHSLISKYKWLEMCKWKERRNSWVLLQPDFPVPLYPEGQLEQIKPVEVLLHVVRGSQLEFRQYSEHNQF